MKKIFVLPALLFITSCATSVSTKLANNQFSALSPQDQIFVLEENETLPANSQFVGDIKIGDSGFTTDCGYNKVMADATATARNAGANILKVVTMKDPSAFGSTCYRLKAKIYRNLDSELLAGLQKRENFKNKSRIPEGSNYALIHFYRPSMATGDLIGFKVKTGNDSIIGSLRNGKKFTYKTTEFGDQTFYAVLETKEEIKINVEKGKEYFVRGGMNMGIVLARPDLNIMDANLGLKEFEALE